ncbi:Fe-S cluster assembly protein HesB [Herbiconiux moechotypicola]|uniref:HhH-GPD-type base excision DNA repair protein n=1 Tax=Herbiconiux moechotypicola TaxID=637393 RepID=A0ABN3DLI1_9MICO|nr:HhH-GPD-type base excision DNA repair protein [Herbiconiux moechotypicola]MCS5730169.1 Fe-S cluster assembly protein HesB [Herbiconiux moechotypicola]
MTPSLHITGDTAADELLSTDPLALLIGMLLDQQVAMETAFEGPAKIAARIDGPFDASNLAGYDPEALVEVFRQTPAVHRYPGSMAGRVQALCAALVDDWGGSASALWTVGDPDGATLLKRLKALPGFGDQKARIFVALLGKQYGVQPEGWRAAAGAYGEEGSHRSVADIVDAGSLALVRETKRAAKAAAKAGTAK